MSLLTPDASAAGATPAQAAIPEPLTDRLNDPRVLGSLTAVLDHLDVLALALTSADGLLARSETIFDSVLASAADARETVSHAEVPEIAGLDVAAVGGSLLQLAAALPAATPGLLRALELAAALSDPQVSAAIDTLLSHLDLLVLLITSLDGLLAHSETILDSVMASAHDARATVAAADLPDLKGAAEAGSRLAATLPKVTPALVRGVDSGALDALTSDGLLQLINLLAAGATSGLGDPSRVEVKGPLSALRALKDPDVSRALSMFATVTRALGRTLADPSAAPTTTR